MHNIKKIIQSVSKTKRKLNVISFTSNAKYINEILDVDCNFFLIKDEDNSAAKHHDNLYIINNPQLNATYDWDCLLVFNRFHKRMGSVMQLKQIINVPLIAVELNPVQYYFPHIKPGNKIPKRFLDTIKHGNIDIEVFHEKEVMDQWETKSKKYLINANDKISMTNSWQNIFKELMEGNI